ncbi:YaaW family protein [[Leptolyngbya] sp. PCC 7376]|uniref:YaaW family protein n=1 Tax=[Leptolyngbya] sp. PCC 7376 TaxID=111781 RepID=UPI000302E9EE|nr:YaaW family protein [[Leptolyngbya] sp. PCC 7376]
MDELRTALNLATDEELQHLTQILFSRKFNPLDYLNTPQPIFIQTQHRDRQIECIEQRFRHLAADGFTVLLGQTETLTYRQVLLQVCTFLKLSGVAGITTTDLEAEIFLHLTGKAWRKLPAADKTSLLHKVRRSLEDASLPEPLPVQLQHNPFQILLQGSSTLAVSTLLKTAILKNIAKQFALYFASSQMARVTASGAGKLATVISSQAAKKGLATTAVKYGAMRSVFSVVVPAMWGWFLADLGWRAIATNYGRIIPMIVTLAQIRLTREEIAWQKL